MKKYEACKAISGKTIKTIKCTNFNHAIKRVNQLILEELKSNSKVTYLTDLPDGPGWFIKNLDNNYIPIFLINSSIIDEYINPILYEFNSFKFYNILFYINEYNVDVFQNNNLKQTSLHITDPDIIKELILEEKSAYVFTEHNFREGTF